MGRAADAKAILATDPWSADLTLSTALAYAHQQDPYALDLIQRFKLLAPNSPIAKRIVVQ